MKNVTIKELFTDWVDFDVAEYYLACSLGLMKYDPNLHNIFRQVKGVFNTNNKIGNMLFSMLENLVEGGILEESDDSFYRWNSSFNEWWESEI